MNDSINQKIDCIVRELYEIKTKNIIPSDSDYLKQRDMNESVQSLIIKVNHLRNYIEGFFDAIQWIKKEDTHV